MPQPNNSRRGRPPRQAIYERLGIQIGELRDRLGGLPSPVEAEGIVIVGAITACLLVPFFGVATLVVFILGG